MRPAVPLADMLEKEWRGQVLDLAHPLGWKSYFTFKSKGSSHGFPDLVLARERLVLIELKREKTKPTEQQCEWIRALLAAKAEVYVARPSDLDDLAVVLAHRGDPRLAESRVCEAARGLRDRTVDETRRAA